MYSLVLLILNFQKNIWRDIALEMNPPNLTDLDYK